MGIFDLFKKAPSISAAEVHTYIQERQPLEYCLLDVRQPAEYQEGHLPGAKLLPIGQLQGCMSELDREKPLIVYCRTGSRSNSAAALLMAAGFKQVLNMNGGIVRYNGMIASGPPEAGMFCFPESLSPVQLTAVAWFLEDGVLSFLEGISDAGLSASEREVLGVLAGIKQLHKEKLRQLYQDLTRQIPSEKFPADVLDLPGEQIMVGCVKVSDAIQWAKGKSSGEVLEMLISLSANAYDLYLKLVRIANSEETRKVLSLLAKEEESNINEITKAFEKTL